MKKLIIILILIIIAFVGFWVWRHNQPVTNSYQFQSPATLATTTPMQISSPAFLDGQSIPDKYTCNGDGVNPPLNISNVPTGAASLALIVDDPDAPTGTWTHWTLWNINASTTSISENSVPAGATQGQTSFGQNVYGGPCPPAGNSHHYHFKLYALDSKLTIPSYSQVQDVVAVMNGHIVAQAELVGMYGRSK